MKIIKKSVTLIFLVLTVNQLLLFTSFEFSIVLKTLLSLLLSSFYIFYNIYPLTKGEPNPQLTKLKRCYNILFSAASLFLIQSLLYLGLVFFADISWLILILNLILSLLASYVLVINGLVRSFAVSRQMNLIFRILLLSFWWLPFVNSIFAILAARTIRQKFQFDRQKFQLNLGRKDQAICQTKYPLVMVHGIFFRDWEIFNYWGRIPAELTANGAQIFYGEHDSSLSVVESAEQIKEKVLDILKKTGADKVNIIAHSKGGIDSRYAISCLGLAPYVASLTTINSPHHGSALAGKMLSMTPKQMVSTIGEKYSKLFTRLGDSNVDFVSAVQELTTERCEELNQAMPDAPGVFYQSTGSTMTSRKSAAFPLNLAYSIIKPLAGDNDGLVATDSMPWGHFLGIQKASGKAGISHGDMIDLTRKNIKGFDVLEYYVTLVSDLKKQGF